ncbi:hypothetical protein B0A48_13613 [Cryoendolithus antarcticus]|uniref:histidine kinase n=1 Tax=Cryoendolithus antarcticus TaxID=1507870 RepID=A0A1V8SPF0_9PEZI|nr:hypothetical protein B0A48_13613 [Cryoendolithus antarcticus]
MAAEASESNVDNDMSLASTPASLVNDRLTTRKIPVRPMLERSETSSGHAWTESVPNTEHNALFLNYDWTKTPLGRLSNWDPILRSYACMVFADSRGACLYWGPKLVALYNAEFAVFSGGAHPKLMGATFTAAFPELVDSIQPMFTAIYHTGQAVSVDNIELMTVRHGFLEEAYFVGQFVPVWGMSGIVEGVYNTTYESTSKVLAERRRRVTELVANMESYPVERTLTEFIQALRSNPRDITVALMYTYEALVGEGMPNLTCAGSIGIPEGHKCAPQTALLETDQAGLIPLFRKARNSSTPVVMNETNSDMTLFDGVAWAGFGEPSRTIVICALEISGNLQGFFLVGTNPRRAYDEATESSITDIAARIKLKWAESISKAQARKREAVLERLVSDSETRLQHMAHSAPVGMCQIGLDSRIAWANDQFYQITGHDRSKPDMSDFRAILDPEEYEKHDQLVANLLQGNVRAVREFRLKRTWKPPVSQEDDEEPYSAWMLATNFPLIEHGLVKLLMVYVTDISHQKWAESVQVQRAKLATQAKQRQEAFLDMTSHEMRNPLTAITQLADGIARSVQYVPEVTPKAWQDVAEQSAAAADTILACAAHQRRVIDDVLILSRLDSQMLSIVPVCANTEKVVRDTIRMFSGEAANNDISITAVKAMEPKSLQMINHVLLDTSRMAQVLINLISNAIKFTATQDLREITVTYGIQPTKPPDFRTKYGEITWVTPTAAEHDNAALPPLQAGEDRLYAYFLVRDTGPGIDQDGINRLFQRFSQATPKTHITYGGSGLGLYIVRELVEKQGGRVGVASVPGEGSVFAFYVATMAGDEPETPTKPRMTTAVAKNTVTNGMPECSSEEDCGLEADHVRTTGTADPEADRVYNILLVEDNIINQRILAKQLRMAGSKVEVAENGVDALAVLERSDIWHEADSGPNYPTSDMTIRTKVDLILMDVEMPIMDGLTATRRIRELEAEGRLTTRLPIIAVTANVRQEQVDTAVQAGVDRVLSKPFTTGEALEAIREVVT